MRDRKKIDDPPRPKPEVQTKEQYRQELVFETALNKKVESDSNRRKPKNIRDADQPLLQ